MSTRTKIEEAARARLEIGEPLLASGFVWIAIPRPQVSLLWLARRPHFLGLTDRRILVWARPHARRSADGEVLVLDAAFRSVTLLGVRTRSPMLQVRIQTEPDRTFVLEFRPRDRRLGHRLVQALGAPAPVVAPASG